MLIIGGYDLAKLTIFRYWGGGDLAKLIIFRYWGKGVRLGWVDLLYIVWGIFHFHEKKY